jgi:amino acid transporter
VGDPLAYIFKESLPWLSGLIAFSAILSSPACSSFFNSQPRIWMSMSRDGLRLIFSHPSDTRYGRLHDHPGLVVAIPALFSPSEVVDPSSISTLFAFVLVCGGFVLRIQRILRQTKIQDAISTAAT